MLKIMPAECAKALLDRAACTGSLDRLIMRHELFDVGGGRVRVNCVHIKLALHLPNALH